MGWQLVLDTVGVLVLLAAAHSIAESIPDGANPCASGTISPNGHDLPDSCVNCTPGKFQEFPANSICDDCAAGKYSSEGLSACIDCEPGKRSPIGVSVCVNCTPGLFSLTGYPECDPCPNNTFSLYGISLCSNCSVGMYSNTSQSECSDCEAGFFNNETGTPCEPCAAGTLSPPGATFCFACDPGTFQQTGQNNCTDCPAGSFTNASGGTECIPCDPGRYQPGVGLTDCIACPLGQYQNSSGEPSCQPCDVGTFADSLGTVDCTSCPANTIAPLTGSPFCSVNFSAFAPAPQSHVTIPFNLTMAFDLNVTAVAGNIKIVDTAFEYPGTTFQAACSSVASQSQANVPMLADGWAELSNSTSDAYIEVAGTLPSFNGANFSWSVWVLRTRSGTDEMLMSRGTTNASVPTEQAVWYWNAADQFVVGTANDTLASNTSFAGDVNVWHHWCGTFTVRASDGLVEVAVYRDGTAVTMVHSVANVSCTTCMQGQFAVPDDTPLLVGRREGSSSMSLQGSVDELTWWTSVITSTEIAALGAGEPYQVLYFALKELDVPMRVMSGAPSLLEDLSGNKHVVMMHNATYRACQPGQALDISNSSLVVVSTALNAATSAVTSVLSIYPIPGLVFSDRAYHVQIDPSCFAESGGLNDTTWTVFTPVVTERSPVLLRSDPMPGFTNTSTGRVKVTLEFSERIVAGSGAVHIFRESDGYGANYTVPGSNVTVYDRFVDIAFLQFGGITGVQIGVTNGTFRSLANNQSVPGWESGKLRFFMDPLTPTPAPTNTPTTPPTKAPTTPPTLPPTLAPTTPPTLTPTLPPTLAPTLAPTLTPTLPPTLTPTTPPTTEPTLAPTPSPTPQHPPDPSPPQILSVNATVINLKLDDLAPVYAGFCPSCPPLTGYELRIANDANMTENLRTDGDFSTRYIRNISGLIPQTDYYFDVIAVTVDPGSPTVTSARSAVVHAKTWGQPVTPSAPILLNRSYHDMIWDISGAVDAFHGGCVQNCNVSHVELRMHLFSNLQDPNPIIFSTAALSKGTNGTNVTLPTRVHFENLPFNTTYYVVAVVVTEGDDNENGTSSVVVTSTYWLPCGRVSFCFQMGECVNLPPNDYCRCPSGRINDDCGDFSPAIANTMALGTTGPLVLAAGGLAFAAWTGAGAVGANGMAVSSGAVAFVFVPFTLFLQQAVLAISHNNDFGEDLFGPFQDLNGVLGNPDYYTGYNDNTSSTKNWMFSWSHGLIPKFLIVLFVAALYTVLPGRIIVTCCFTIVIRKRHITLYVALVATPFFESVFDIPGQSEIAIFTEAAVLLALIWTYALVVVRKSLDEKTLKFIMPGTGWSCRSFESLHLPPKVDLTAANFDLSTWGGSDFNRFVKAHGCSKDLRRFLHITKWFQPGMLAASGQSLRSSLNKLKKREDCTDRLKQELDTLLDSIKKAQAIARKAATPKFLADVHVWKWDDFRFYMLSRNMTGEVLLFLKNHGWWKRGKLMEPDENKLIESVNQWVKHPDSSVALDRSLLKMKDELKLLRSKANVDERLREDAANEDLQTKRRRQAARRARVSKLSHKTSSMVDMADAPEEKKSNTLPGSLSTQWLSVAPIKVDESARAIATPRPVTTPSAREKVLPDPREKKGLTLDDIAPPPYKGFLCCRHGCVCRLFWTPAALDKWAQDREYYRWLKVRDKKEYIFLHENEKAKYKDRRRELDKITDQQIWDHTHSEDMRAFNLMKRDDDKDINLEEIPAFDEWETFPYRGWFARVAFYKLNPTGTRVVFVEWLEWLRHHTTIWWQFVEITFLVTYAAAAVAYDGAKQFQHLFFQTCVFLGVTIILFPVRRDVMAQYLVLFPCMAAALYNCQVVMENKDDSWLLFITGICLGASLPLQLLMYWLFPSARDEERWREHLRENGLTDDETETKALKGVVVDGDGTSVHRSSSTVSPTVANGLELTKLSGKSGSRRGRSMAKSASRESTKSAKSARSSSKRRRRKKKCEKTKDSIAAAGQNGKTPLRSQEKPSSDNDTGALASQPTTDSGGDDSPGDTAAGVGSDK